MVARVPGASVADPTVRELAALSGRALPLLRQWVADQPQLGGARALLVLASGAGLSDDALRAELTVAHRDALAGPDSWTWVSRMAWIRAEQGRAEAAYELAAAAGRADTGPPVRPGARPRAAGG